MYFQDDGYYVTRYAEQKVSSVSNSYRVCRNSKKKKKKGAQLKQTSRKTSIRNVLSHYQGLAPQWKMTWVRVSE